MVGQETSIDNLKKYILLAYLNRKLNPNGYKGYTPTGNKSMNPTPPLPPYPMYKLAPVSGLKQPYNNPYQAE